MSKYSELTKLAEASKDCYAPPEAWSEDRRYCDEEVAMLDFIGETTPSTILEIIDERNDLLEALESFADLGIDESSFNDWPELSAFIIKVNAAIAKARGES